MRIYKNIKKSFRLSQDLYEKSLLIAKDTGLDYSDYLRYLISSDIRKSKEESSDLKFKKEFVDKVQKSKMFEDMFKHKGF